MDRTATRLTAADNARAMRLRNVPTPDDHQGTPTLLAPLAPTTSVPPSRRGPRVGVVPLAPGLGQIVQTKRKSMLPVAVGDDAWRWHAEAAFVPPVPMPGIGGGAGLEGVVAARLVGRDGLRPTPW